MIAYALYQWAKKNLVETLVFLTPKENHAITAQELKSRFASANTVPDTQKYHSFLPSAELTLMLRKYSSSLECDVFPKKLWGKEEREVHIHCNKQEVLYMSTNFFFPTFDHGSF